MRRPRVLDIHKISKNIMGKIHDVLGIGFHGKEMLNTQLLPYIIWDNKQVCSFNFIINKHQGDVENIYHVINNILLNYDQYNVDVKFIIALNDIKLNQLDVVQSHEEEGITYHFIRHTNKQFTIVLTHDDIGTDDIVSKYIRMYNKIDFILNQHRVKLNYHFDIEIKTYNYVIAYDVNSLMNLTFDIQEYGITSADFLYMLNFMLRLFTLDYFSTEEAERFILQLGVRDRFTQIWSIFQHIHKSVEAIYSVEAIDENSVESLTAKKKCILDILAEQLKHILD